MTTAPPPPPTSTRPPGPSIAWSLIVGAVGLVIGIVAVVAIVVPLVGVFTSSEYQVPGTINLHLHKERYTVYQRTGERSPFGISNSDGSTVRIPPTALTVTAPDNSTVPVSYDDRAETITRGSTQYTSSLVFDPPSSGEYVLVFSNSIQPTTVIVARSVSDAIRGVLVWFAVGGLGLVILIAGIVMLIIGAARRGRARRAAYAASWGAGGGWYGAGAPQWSPPASAPGYPPVYPPQYPPPQYPAPQYPPPQYPPPPAPPPPAPSEPPAESPPPDQPNP